MSILTIYLDNNMRKIAKFENIINSISNYLAIYNKVTSLVNSRSYI